MKNFDPGAVGQSNGNFFGFPFTVEESPLVLFSVPWDVTTSYGGGAAAGPQAILDASPQLDFYHPKTLNAWQKGIGTLPIDSDIASRSERLRPVAKRIIMALESGKTPQPEDLNAVNTGSEFLNNQVYEKAMVLLQQGKIIGMVGGDHSTPFGLIKALGKFFTSIGVLQLDAHADLRVAYEGFDHSHASIMHNVLQLNHVVRLTQVGVRDFSMQEALRAQTDSRINFYDAPTLHDRKFRGDTWDIIAQEIVNTLPQFVYISFDIDGLDPSLCPNTGTPVPGGLAFEEAVYLIEKVKATGRQIIGFDINEVSPGPHSTWDANVGARILFQLCCHTLAD